MIARERVCVCVRERDRERVRERESERETKKMKEQHALHVREEIKTAERKNVKARVSASV